MAMAVLAAGAGPILLPVGERDWFAMPGAGDFRVQSIERQPGEADWPFVHDRGMLACAFVNGRRQGFFVPLDENGTVPDDGEGVPLTGSPVEMFSFYMAMRDEFVPMTEVAELVRRVAPLAETAKRLCDQPRGSSAPGGDL